MGTAVLPSPAAYAQVPELDRLVGRDLLKEPAGLERLNKMLGYDPAGGFKPAPWHVWRTSRDGQTRYVVLLGASLFQIPGESSARVQLFDGAGKPVNAWSFRVGYRIKLADASFEFSADLGSDLIVISTLPVINGMDIVKEYYGIGHDRLLLVRLENSKGEAAQNEYVNTGWEIGVAPDAKNADEFAAMLESNDATEILSALVFLGGRHLAQAGYSGDPDGRLFQELMDSPRIHALIDRLSNSSNAWIAQAAKLAARPPRERLLQ
jgi:hypothetical protein